MSELNGLRNEVSLDHERDLKGDGVVELAQVETCELAYFLKSVNEGISVYEELSRGLGDVQVVLEEALDCHKGFAVERIEASVLEDLLEEHLAKGRGKLIDKSADAEILIADDVLFGVEYLSDLKGDLSLLVGAGEILDIVDSRTDTDGNLSKELRVECVGDVACHFLDLANVGSCLDILNYYDILLGNTDDKLAALVRENILYHIEGQNIGAGIELDEKDYANLIGVEVQLLGLDVDVTRKNVVEDDVLYERALVILLVIKILDIGKCNGEDGRHLLSQLVLAFDENDILPLGARTDRPVGVAAGGDCLCGVSELIANTLSELTYFDKLTAGDDNTVVINDSDYTVDGIPHLMDDSLEQTICHC